MQMGVRSVSMDDLCSKLKISKKTLYANFKDKGDLVSNAVFHHFQEIQIELDTIRNSGHSPIEKMFIGAQFAVEQLSKVNPQMIEDLKRYHREIYEKLEQHRIGAIKKHIHENIWEGRSLGVYRKDFDESVIAPLFVELLFHLTQGLASGDTPYSLNAIQELVKYHLHGICTDKGLIEIEKTLKNEI